MSVICRGISILLLALLSFGPALAVCPVGLLQVRYVGNMATDHNCTDGDAQTAINNASCPGAQVVLSDEVSYSGKALTISNRSLTLLGSPGSCGAQIHNFAADAALAKVVLTGNGALPVIQVTGNSTVTLQNLDISGGAGRPSFSADAGGVSFIGHGSLTLRTVELHANHGQNGGGVSFFGGGTFVLDNANIHSNTSFDIGGGVVAETSAAPDHIEFTVKGSTLAPTAINANVASVFGGGVYAAGDVHMVAVSSQPDAIVISSNTAGDSPTSGFGLGGGIFYQGSAFADIALPKFAINGNVAANGGAIYVGGAFAQSITLRLFTTLSDEPTTIGENKAYLDGGGIYVASSFEPNIHSTVCMFDSSIIENDAGRQGSGIFVNNGAHFFINPENNAECDYTPLAALGGGRCDPSASLFCNVIGQGGVVSGSTATDVAAAYFDGATTVSASRIEFRDNTTAAIIASHNAAGSSIKLSNCLIHKNSVTSVATFDGAAASFDGCSIADNTISGPTIFSFNTGINLKRSIVRETKALLDTNAAGIVAQFMILSVPQTITGSSIEYTDPMFAGSADYHLQTGSPAIDFALAGGEASSVDFDGEPREVELKGVPNLFGPRDLGPYEYQIGGVLDRIFLDGFE